MQPEQRRWRGLDDLAAALAIESFPMDKDGLYYSVGDLVLVDELGNGLAVRDLLDRVNDREFESAEQAVRAIAESIS